MKAKVLKKFKDKYTGKIHEEGAILTISRERFAEILQVAPLVEEIKKSQPQTKRKENENG